MIRHEIEQCFKPHVDRIVAATKEQIETAEGRSKVIFCCGGFGSNAYLRQKRNISLLAIWTMLIA